MYTKDLEKYIDRLRELIATDEFTINQLKID